MHVPFVGVKATHTSEAAVPLMDIIYFSHRATILEVSDGIILYVPLNAAKSAMFLLVSALL